MEQTIFDSPGEPLYMRPEKLWHRLSKPFRLAFASAFFTGLIVHWNVLSNLYLNHDGVRHIRSINSNFAFGRWSSFAFSSLSGLYEMPVVIALLAIIALALCAGLTVCILGIRSPACIFLVSGFMVTFPSIACTFPYLHAADAFFIAAFLHVAAVYAAKRFRYGWFPAILCIAASLGIYQAFIGCSVALFLFDCIFELFSDTSTKSILKRGLRYIGVILAGLVLYRIVMVFSLWITHKALANYKGISTANNSGLVDYLRTLPLTYRQFILFFWSPSYMAWPLRLLQVIMFALAGGCFFFLVARKRIHKNLPRLFLLICGVVMLPAALNLICVICAGQTDVNMLMQYSYVFTYVFVLKLFEMTAMETQSPRYKTTKHATVLTGLALCTVLVWTNFCVTNEAYLALDLSMEVSRAIGIRTLSRLEALEDYTPGETPVMFIDSKPVIERLGIDFPELTGMSGIDNYNLLYNYTAPAFLERFCGSGDLLGLDRESEQYAAIISTGAVDSMPAFPAKDSIRWYDGVVIVKLS